MAHSLLLHIFLIGFRGKGLQWSIHLLLCWIGKFSNSKIRLFSIWFSGRIALLIMLWEVATVFEEKFPEFIAAVNLGSRSH